MSSRRWPPDHARHLRLGVHGEGRRRQMGLPATVIFNLLAKDEDLYTVVPAGAPLGRHGEGTSHTSAARNAPLARWETMSDSSRESRTLATTPRSNRRAHEARAGESLVKSSASASAAPTSPPAPPRCRSNSYPRIPVHYSASKIRGVRPPSDYRNPGHAALSRAYLNPELCAPAALGPGNCCESLKVLGVMPTACLAPGRFVCLRASCIPPRPLPPTPAPRETLGHRYPAVERGAPQKGRGGPRPSAPAHRLAAMQFAKCAAPG